MIIHCEWTETMTEKKQTSLLDALAECIGCPYLSELHYIKEDGRKKLIQKLEAISPEVYPPGDWNATLSYLTTAPPSPPEEARRRLLHHYRNQEDNPLSNSPKGGNDYESE